ncbi:serine dehydratase subunit alpha family protein [Oribacterium parvum]|jgi:UPF0597 protein HMPREF6123_2319|uniref:L-cysteine desulfidase family protein n=1 Tax=Oribacterium parvum TaxID=1501329 RepID=UPI0028E87BBA|nr:L-serine ammonia-lyase, iron-sulfur-dependent, subunit alpha [Oribacterium parvum]
MEERLIKNYTEILEHELVPAMGCTEPIAIAYAAASARKLLSEEVKHIDLCCSGNIIKNVKAVTVPNSGGQKGMQVAAILGVLGGDADKKLEVLSTVTDADREKCKSLVNTGFCKVGFEEDVPKLYIRVEVSGENHKVRLDIADQHSNIVLMEKDGEVLYKEGGEDKQDVLSTGGDRSLMSLKGIIEYADTVNLDEVAPTLQRQIDMNMAISQEGLDNAWGASVGKTILETWGHDVKSCACARAAAGSDARMSGCPLPVVINSGSGNQGITVSMPVVEYAKSLEVSKEKLYRSLIVSNLVSVYIKHYIGALSAFCGAVSASCGAGAGITYMCGGDYHKIGKTISNTLGNVGGIVCDGAKPSCAAKIASSVHAAILAHSMSMKDQGFNGGEGIVDEDIENTIKNIGYIGKVGMLSTDREILNVMTDQVDVDSCL